MSDDCESLIDSASEGGLGAEHPPFLSHPVLVAPTYAEDYNTIRAAIVPIACWRLDDLRFEFASSFVRPEAAGELRHLARLVKVHPGAPLTIFGHADPVGNDQFNKVLSGRRATAVYAMLTRKTALWEELYSKPHGQDDWKKNKVVPFIRQDLGLPPEAGDGNSGSRAQLFQAYMDKYCRDQQGGSFRLGPADFLGRGAGAGGKGDYHGCSEFNPVLMFSRAEHQAFSQASDKAERDAANAPNRRVVVFLFRPGSKINVAKWPCPPATKGMDLCRKRFWSDADERRKFQPLRREFAATRDTFACRFYERIAGRSPCEAGVERSLPTLYVPEEPNSYNWVPLHSLWVYLVHFRGTEIEILQRLKLREGKLCDDQDRLVPVHCNRHAWFYFSHRDDLLTLDRARWFARDRSGLPLVGPFCVPCGPQARINIDIWQQNDWAIVRASRVDGARADKVMMAEWREDYGTGRLLPMQGGGIGFYPHGSYTEKQRQERWKGGTTLIPLIQFGSPGDRPMWVGTLSALPSPKAKLLLVHGVLYPGTYNELAPTGRNQEFPGHHLYDRFLVSRLLALGADDQAPAAIDALPDPPARCLVPGDMCWQTQGETPNCGPYSFSTAMNYWMPYTNNPAQRDGAWYAGRIDAMAIPAGARTPAHLADAAVRFHMNGRDNDAEEINRARALKVLKLWLQAGVPALILVKEEYGITSYHWKTVVGYDGNRFFMNNSGADNELIRARRTPGIEYERAPIGNDVDSETAFYDKWKAGGGDIVDLITSVDECTFIPLFPNDSMFGGGAAV